ncbi:hypothetical protein Tco_0499547, partial [Tanacetum coccineum]
MAWLDSRQDDKRIDRMTKSALCHSWIYGRGIDKSTDGIMSSDEEWEESYGNLPDTTTNLSFKTYLTHERNNIKKEDERGQMKRKCSNASNSNYEQPNKR